jgi:glutamate-1-semialdehyde 2,1-aminomutase
MRGILAVGTHLPYRRLDLATVAAVAGKGGRAGTRTVASYDEDATTLAVAAGRAALGVLGSPEGCAYERLEWAGAHLEEGIEAAAHRHGVPVTVQRQGSMLGIFFTDRPVRHLADVQATDRERFARVFHRLLAAGVHLPPSAYEACFLSTAHGEAEIRLTVEAFDRALAAEAAGE